jgi:CubicO group peptidase (beta-lactamase class C family)
MHPNDPVSKYLPDSPAEWKNIRIRHLLEHESGLKWITNIESTILAKELTGQ